MIDVSDSASCFKFAKLRELMILAELVYIEKIECRRFQTPMQTVRLMSFGCDSAVTILYIKSCTVSSETRIDT